MTLSNKRIKNVETFKKKTGNAPDVSYKDYPIKNKIITLNEINDNLSTRAIIESLKKGFVETLIKI